MPEVARRKKETTVAPLRGGPVKAPVVFPPRETIFEDTAITITPQRSSETVLYTIDAPHDFKINPFAPKAETSLWLKYYKRPIELPPGIHRIAALSFSKANPHAAPSPVVRRTFRVQPRDSPIDPLSGKSTTRKARGDFVKAYGGTQDTVADIVPCEFLLLVDQSGSMKGLCFERIREAVKLLVRKFPRDCRVNLIGFGQTAFPLWPRSVPGTPENCVKLLDYAERMSTSQGATNLAQALRSVFEPHAQGAAAPMDTTTARSTRMSQTMMKRVPGYERQIIVLSDGELQDGYEVTRLLKKHHYDRRLWLVSFGDRANRVLLDKLAQLGDGGTAYIPSTDKSIQPTVLNLLDRAQAKPKRMLTSALKSLDRAMTRLDHKSTPRKKLDAQAEAERTMALKTQLWDSAVETLDATALAHALADLDASKARVAESEITDALAHNGRTALHHAASKGGVAVAAKLLDHPAGRAQVAMTDPSGRTPLHWAAWNGDMVMVRLLVEKGYAVADCTDDASVTPSFMARQEGHVDVAEYLDAAVGRTPLHHAAWNGDLALAEALIQPTGPPPTREFRTAQELERQKEKIDKKAAVIDPLDGRGLSPIFLATAQGHRAIATLLARHGAVDASLVRRFFSGNPTWTPLHWAAFRGDADWCQRLIDQGADLKNRLYRGMTPLEVAENAGKEGSAAANVLRAAAFAPVHRR
eukprot:m.37383 g.37383  ORF g.37383 m.37383 type:complete len:697 (+) comp5524_c0_seq2:203-2293(+)